MNETITDIIAEMRNVPFEWAGHSGSEIRALAARIVDDAEGGDHA